MFKLIKDADINGTHKQGTLICAPALLVKAFGRSEHYSFDHKVTGEYEFASDEGDIFTVYDYKATSAYAPDLPDPETFWKSDRPHDFSIGSRESNIKHFLEWIKTELTNTFYRGEKYIETKRSRRA